MFKVDNKTMSRIKAERLKRQWTQTDLAFYARMSSSDISRIENGRMIPYPGHLERLSKALGIDSQELLQEVEVSR